MMCNGIQSNLTFQSFRWVAILPQVDTNLVFHVSWLFSLSWLNSIQIVIVARTSKLKHLCSSRAPRLHDNSFRLLYSDDISFYEIWVRRVFEVTHEECKSGREDEREIFKLRKIFKFNNEIMSHREAHEFGKDEEKIIYERQEILLASIIKLNFHNSRLIVCRSTRHHQLRNVLSHTVSCAHFTFFCII